MMKPDKTFRMRPEFKTMVTLMKGTSEEKNHFKRMLIDAQLCEESARRAALKSKDTGDSKSRSRGAVAPE
jgi:hypothetical protein